MGDIVVRTHIPASNNIPYETLKVVLTEIVMAIYPNTDVVAIIEGTENEQGINAIQIRTYINKGTSDHIQDILGKTFGQKFEISVNSENTSQDTTLILKEVGRRIYQEHHKK